MRYETVAEAHLKIAHRNGNEVYAYCPFHANTNTPALQFNVKTGLWVCFVCKNPKDPSRNLGGTARLLVEKMGKEYTEPSVGLEYLQMSLRALSKQREPDYEVFILEDSYLNRFKAPTDYWHGRGFTDNAIEYFSLGYDVFSDRGTIPYRDIHGRLLGVIYRRFDDGFPKYRYPAGFPRKFSLFNSWSIASMEPPYDVAIVEGSLDAAKCWQADVPAVAQYGSSITPEQVVLLHRIGVQSVTLFYDNDPAGFSATIKALQMLKEFHVRIVNYPSNWPSDPGAMSTKQIRKCYRSAQAFHV